VSDKCQALHLALTGSSYTTRS